MKNGKEDSTLNINTVALDDTAVPEQNYKQSLNSLPLDHNSAQP
jgi:hypothetical protein